MLPSERLCFLVSSSLCRKVLPTLLWVQQVLHSHFDQSASADCTNWKAAKLEVELLPTPLFGQFCHPRGCCWSSVWEQEPLARLSRMFYKLDLDGETHFPQRYFLLENYRPSFYSGFLKAGRLLLMHKLLVIYKVFPEAFSEAQVTFTS